VIKDIKPRQMIWIGLTSTAIIVVATLLRSQAANWEVTALYTALYLFFGAISWFFLTFLMSFFTKSCGKGWQLKLNAQAALAVLPIYLLVTFIVKWIIPAGTPFAFMIPFCVGGFLLAKALNEIHQIRSSTTYLSLLTSLAIVVSLEIYRLF